jgi:microbial collagenase
MSPFPIAPLALLLPAALTLQVQAKPQQPPPRAANLTAERPPARAHRPQDAKSSGVPLMPLQPRALSLGQIRTAAVATTYRYADLNAMSYADLVTTLAGIRWSQVTDLFQYNPDAVTFYQDANRVQALISAIQSRGATFTDSDDKGIPTLVEVLRAGFFLGYYHSDLSSLDARSYKDKCLPAIQATQANANFRLGTATQNGVIQSMGMLISNADSSPAVINAFTPILQDYNANWATYMADSTKASAVWNVTSAIDYDLTWNVLGGNPYSATLAGPFAGSIDGYLAQITALATTHGYSDPGIRWLIDSSVYIAGYDGRFHSNGTAGLQAVTTAIQRYGSAPWTYASAQAAEVIHDLYNDRDANGRVQSWTQIQSDIRTQYTPVKRDFDGGLFHTQVGSAVDPTKVKTLVWAHKETKAQFFRALRRDTPIDPSHHQDDSLTMVIYDSPDAYKMNRFAYGLSTDNGGIMIESLGTFFTYERTPAQSYYSLEELFRHEGVHYLQGRFEEPGFFGDAPLYDHDRLTWIDEGSAEFFAGSTRTEGVKPRYIKAHLIQGYDPSTWYSVSQVVNATYASGWTFYDYASEFVDYLYHGPWDNYLAMLDRLKANDPSGFSAICAQDATSGTLNNGYQSWLQYVAANVGTFSSPSTSPDYLARIPAKPLAQVASDIQSATGLTGISTSTTTGLDWNTYTLRGTYAAGTSRGSLLADWQAMDAQANAWLQALSAKSWAGYKTDTCYFVNYAKDAANRVTWQVVFHGVNTDNGAPANTVTAAINTPASNLTITSGTVVSFAGSATDSSSAAQLSYTWTFGDGTTASGASATHAFTNAGVAPVLFTVTFTATDDTGASATATRTITVNPTSTAPTVALQVATAPGKATFQPHVSSNVTKVTYWVDQLAPFSLTTAPFDAMYSTSAMTAGSKHLVYARAYNAAGAYADSGWVPFTVLSDQLSIQVKATPAAGGSVTFTPTVGGNVSKVIFYVDRWDLFTTATTSPWTGQMSGLAPGTHYVCAEALDAAGHTVYTSWVAFVMP